MPVVHFHISNEHVSSAQAETLLCEASRTYAEILECPLDRIRAFIVGYDAQKVAVGGKVCHENSDHAPYFEFIVLEGRSLEQRQTLMARFCDVISTTLDVERSIIRGRCISVSPEVWCIAGKPAASVRQSEILERKKQVNDEV